MLFGEFIINFPAATCATWLILTFVCRNSYKVRGSLVGLLAFLFVFLLMEGIYCSREVDYRVLATAFPLAQSFALCLYPFAWLVYDGVKKGGKADISASFFLIFPVILYIISLIVRFLTGFDNVVAFHRAYDQYGTYPYGFADRIYKTYYFTTFVLFYIINALELLVFVVFILADMVKSRFSGPLRTIQVLFILFPLIFLPRAALSRNFLLDHLYIEYIVCVCVAIGVTLFSYLIIFGNRKAVEAEGTMVPDLQPSVPDPQQPEPAPAIQQQPATPASPAAPAISTSQISLMLSNESNDGSLISRFEQLMFKEQAFLTPGLTIVDIADKLHSNKTYISKLVNQNYAMPFPDLVNSLRIDYAEQYILHNTDAKQKDVAEACGFPSASSLNNTFKKVTGMTPKVWLANNLK